MFALIVRQSLQAARASPVAARRAVALVQDGFSSLIRMVFMASHYRGGARCAVLPFSFVSRVQKEESVSGGSKNFLRRTILER